MMKILTSLKLKNEKNDCSDSTIATNVEELAEVDNDDGCDLDQSPAELFGVHDVSEAFN